SRACSRSAQRGREVRGRAAPAGRIGRGRSTARSRGGLVRPRPTLRARAATSTPAALQPWWWLAGRRRADRPERSDGPATCRGPAPARARRTRGLWRPWRPPPPPSALPDAAFEAHAQQLLGLDRELHRQLLEHFLAEAVHDHVDRVLGADPALLEVEEL